MDSDEESDEPLRLHLVLGAVVLVRSSYVVLPRMSYVILFFKYKLVNKHINDRERDIYIYIGLFLMVKLRTNCSIWFIFAFPHYSHLKIHIIW